MSKNISTKLKVLGYYQIIGGVIGIALLIWLLLTLRSLNLYLLALVAPAFLLFLFSMYTGNRLLTHDPKALNLSIINQSLQLFSFTFAGYAYQYVSGLYVTIALDISGSFNLWFGIGISSWKAQFNTGESFIQISFNVLALCIIILLTNIKNQIRDEENAALIEELASPQ